jgi:hypothetical protein
MPSDHFNDLELEPVEPPPLPPDVAEAIRLLLLSSADGDNARRRDEGR